MSTGLNCRFIEVQLGRWYYLLEDWDAPKGAFDWREYATAYGPFGTEDEATEHLSENQANPGGWSRMPYRPGFEPDEVLAQLIDEAEGPRPRTPGDTADFRPPAWSTSGPAQVIWLVPSLVIRLVL